MVAAGNAVLTVLIGVTHNHRVDQVGDQRVSIKWKGVLLIAYNAKSLTVLTMAIVLTELTV